MLRNAFVSFLVASLALACGDDEESSPYHYRASGSSGCGTIPSPLPDYCRAVSDWDAQWEDFESEVLRLTNARRAEGADCGVHGTFPPAGALTCDPLLRCAARNQSLDMAERDFFDHVNPDHEDPADRVNRTGYSWSATGENIAAGSLSAEAVVQGWMESDDHCSNIMYADFQELGVGYYFQGADPYRHYWTQSFGRPW